MISEMMAEDIMTEVGAYEAIHSDRDQEQSPLEAASSQLIYDGSSHTEAINIDAGEPLLQAVVEDDEDNNAGSPSDQKPLLHSHPYKHTVFSAPKVPKTIKCPNCRRYFSTEEEVQAHQIVRHSAEMNERFKCFECNQAFSSQGSLYKHQKIHTGERPYVCETCLKSFNQLANLQRHFMVHTGEKPFACKTCGKQFSQQSNVDKHQVTHSKVKPFACTICDKQFTQRANLQKHERVHTGERPYVCPICRKCYAQHANMKKHVLTHNKPNDTMAYLCAKCKKLYDTVLLYDAHLDFCEGDNQDYDFEMIATELTDADDNEASGSAVEAILGTTNTPSSNKINIMNVIKAEEDEMLDSNDDEHCAIGVEYLDD